MNPFMASNSIKSLLTLCAVSALLTAQAAFTAEMYPGELDDEDIGIDTDADIVSEDVIDADDISGDGLRTAPPEWTPPPGRADAADRTAPNQGALYFTDVDNNNDYRLNWEEIRTSYEQEVIDAEWGRQEFLSEFDTDEDEFLDIEEYGQFINELDFAHPEQRTTFIDIN